MEKLRLLSLFAGIGGFELGLERSGGFQTVAQCEIDPYCNQVLAKHWPEVKRYGDIRELTAARLAADGVAVDAICGGFPCQDISTAGKGAGIEGERSGLWGEYARLIGELRPRVVFVENVAALLGRGLDRVLGDLASLRYDAVWDCIPASAVGAPHQRDRLWLIAYASGLRREPRGPSASTEQGSEAVVALARRAGAACNAMAHADSIDAQRRLGRRLDPKDWRFAGERSAGLCGIGAGHDWSTEPDVGRVAHGVPNRAHRIRALGNAVVPQIPELLGRAYLQAMEPA
jgi:DNA (cytosine-5)-methyltransferase 1